MAEALSPVTLFRNDRLGAYATSATPAWLWQSDGRRILWANQAAAALEGVASPTALIARAIAEDDANAGQIARLAQTLPLNGSPRLASFKVPRDETTPGLTALCSRLMLDESSPAILVIGTGSSGPGNGSDPDAAAKPVLSPVERTAFDELARRLSAKLNGDQDSSATTGAECNWPERLAGTPSEDTRAEDTWAPRDDDISRWKRVEEDLIEAKQQAERASQAKSDLIAKISHEIRTALNTILGFSEVMMEERAGKIENERYRAYLKDIHASGEHVLALLNDLLDLSKIEAGKLELTFGNINLNALTQDCVALMQPQAGRARVVVRTALSPGLAPILADARSVRQILLNLLSNSLKFTGAGGQVIVSTAAEAGMAVLRVRDTGIGMSARDIETALEPFRQIETAGRRASGGTGLGLPLTKALAEANRANFAIKSNTNSGTLVEIAFPTVVQPPR